EHAADDLLVAYKFRGARLGARYVLDGFRHVSRPVSVRPHVGAPRSRVPTPYRVPGGQSVTRNFEKAVFARNSYSTMPKAAEQALVRATARPTRAVRRSGLSNLGRITRRDDG